MDNRLIKEALGVRPELLEIAKQLYADILSTLSILDPSTSIFFLDKKAFFLNLKNNIFSLKKLSIGFSINQIGYNRLDIINFQTQIPGSLVNDRIIYSDGYNSYILIRINAARYMRVYDLMHHFKEEKALIVSSLSHELKHFFDYLIQKSTKTSNAYKAEVYRQLSSEENRVSQIISNGWYLTSINELIVAPTHLYAELRSMNVTKKTFLEDLKNSDVIKKYQNIAKDFYYDQIYRRIFVRISASMGDSDFKNSTFDESKKYVEGGITNLNELISFATELTFYEARKNFYKSILNQILSNNSKNNLPLANLTQENIDDPKALLSYHNISKTDYYSEPEFSLKDSPGKNKLFFTREINKIRERANNILIKLYKIYSLLPDRKPPNVSGSYKKKIKNN
jgi:hypothetical protein